MVEVSRLTIYRAKKKATQEIMDVVVDQYRKLRSYALTLIELSLGSTVVIAPEEIGVVDEYKFKRIYICLNALRAGFLTGCRPIIGLDGCYLKTAHGGILISAVARDGNDNTFLLVYTVVESENRDS